MTVQLCLAYVGFMVSLQTKPCSVHGTINVSHHDLCHLIFAHETVISTDKGALNDYIFPIYCTISLSIYPTLYHHPPINYQTEEPGQRVIISPVEYKCV